MNELQKKYGAWALVAGAAEGVGEGFSTTLARLGFNLIMVDYNEIALGQLAARIAAQYRIEIRQVVQDLSMPDAAETCIQQAEQVGCRLMVYVAAYSVVKNFRELTEEDLDLSLDINCRTLLHLTHGFTVRLLNDNTSGGIIMISSLAGLIAPVYVSAYSATKAFIIRLAEALSGELKDKGIDVMACTLGTVPTPAFNRSNPDLSGMKPPMMGAAEVAEEALKNLGKKTIFIPGLLNRLSYIFLQKFLPGKYAKGAVDKAMRRMYRKQ